MRHVFKKKKMLIFISCLIVLFVGSFLIYNSISADDNTVIFESIKISKIDTGTETSSFNIDGHNYDDQETDNYISKNIINGYEGNDSNSDNSIVRSFDTIAYHFSYTLFDPEGNEYYDESALTVKYIITFDESIKNIVTIDDPKCNKESDNIYTCSFNQKELGANNGSYEDIINVKVLNADNNTIIDPKFEIYVENSTNFNNGNIVLGNNGIPDNNETVEDESHNYSYINNSYSSNDELSNSLPIVATSVRSNYVYEIVGSPIKQLSTYNGKNGRFITYILGIKFNTENGLVGKSFDSNDINLKIGFAQNGYGEAIGNPSWIRLYSNETIDEIIPAEVSMPYSVLAGENNYIKDTGNIDVRETSDAITSCSLEGCVNPTKSYSVSITGYKVASNIPTLGADNTELNTNSPYLMTLAITNFSTRTAEDGSNLIENIIGIQADNYYSYSSINPYETTAATLRNNYSDYVVNSYFYNNNETENLSLKSNGIGSVSKGTNIKYKTEFDYNRTNSNQGFKEVIKVDTDAYRVVPYENETNQVDIKVICNNQECNGISKDDFEIKYITGDYNNSNYSLNTNYSRLSTIDINNALTCLNVDLSLLNKDQIQNLYGGPCITPNSGVEQVFNNIYDAETYTDEGAKELPITKVVVQTKNGVILPDNSKVIITIGLRVRNVSDITQNYQVTAITSTSDYDSDLIYYSPSITTSMDYNNYGKTIYGGNNVISSNQTTFGDDLKLVNFSSKQKLTVLNKNTDGTVKTNYDASNGEIINYKLSTYITDNNVYVGADDTWYIDGILVDVNIPKELVYVENKNLISPISVRTNSDESVTLTYKLSYTKPNIDIDDILFDAYLSPLLSSEENNITVRVSSIIVNINGEEDTSLASRMKTEFTIVGIGSNNIVNEITTDYPLVEKDAEFSYTLRSYNNTNSDISDYSIVDVLPFNNDSNSSSFNGSYKIKISGDGLDISNIKCIKNNINISNPFDSSITWESCDEILNEYVSNVAAIKIDNISINRNEYMNDINVHIKPNNNKYDDIYNNSFSGKNGSNITTSNVSSVSIVNRKISGKVFIDNTGNGIQDGNESFVSNIPIDLYSIENNNLAKVAETVTNNNGYYEFSKLNSGNYVVRAHYDNSKYDLTLRYATNDPSKDSDAYKINDSGIVEIRSKEINSNGISLNTEKVSADNMDIGLLKIENFGFEMKKYITRIDTTNDGIFSSKLYENEPLVSISVLNPRNYSLKVYYGMSITNNSNKAGYVTLVGEDIPDGMIFDSSIIENDGWFMVNDTVQTDSLSNILIKPGETKELQIVLLLNNAAKAGTFVNNASILQIRKYNEEEDELSQDIEYINSNSYNIGDQISSGGINFHITKITGDVLTLLADENNISMALSNVNPYKWSTSSINNYINNDYLNINSINAPILIDDYICDDASGINNTYGGTVTSISSNCSGGIYTLSKLRLLTKEEFDEANSALDQINSNDKSWLYGNRDYWLMSATTESNKAYYVDHTSSSYKEDIVNIQREVRPVIEVSTYNIVSK